MGRRVSFSPAWRRPIQLSGDYTVIYFMIFNPKKRGPPCERQSMHCNENPIYVFLFWELHGLGPNFHIHVSVSVLYIPRIGPHIFWQQNRMIDCGNI